MAGEDSTVSGVAGRYARALFELALESKSVDAVKSDIEKFDALMRESEDLRRLVRSPVFGAEERSRALAAVLAKTGIGGLAANFLMFLAANRRLFGIDQIIRDFRKLCSASATRSIWRSPTDQLWRRSQTARCCSRTSTPAPRRAEMTWALRG